MGVPLKDLTDGSSIESGFRWTGMDIDEREDNMEINDQEEDALCKASTAEFEEWLAKFLDIVGECWSKHTGIDTTVLLGLMPNQNGRLLSPQGLCRDAGVGQPPQ